MADNTHSSSHNNLEQRLDELILVSRKLNRDFAMKTGPLVKKLKEEAESLEGEVSIIDQALKDYERQTVQEIDDVIVAFAQDDADAGGDIEEV
ncbi:MAG: hypothetical protein COU08_03975 [Candidatus Harrisonbacteria bacterium CG10_big_fil_rev_8_21_14_0_10_42_17]|uniref:Uncharacterized protein n=1 Tax=Candidatus Harrisonbacteria bacterium CG10_big_fil_rev_8_21_14_0_10_42_17 TaxID=1974584 RepID=A0A2M6WH61_9BACT|nr:MAG: hypothetical protein COU08_03975 [Candidatus Harrisonbacteria bacterium CG10_big_fil_rev_8_21_14_0_10_42_17]